MIHPPEEINQFHSCLEEIQNHARGPFSCTEDDSWLPRKWIDLNVIKNAYEYLPFPIDEFLTL